MLAMGSAASEILSLYNNADNESTDMDREVDAGERCSWREVDRNLRAMAKNRALLDAQEAPWLRLVEELQIWRNVGMVSAIDYLERVLGYEPRTAQERLRVARALGNLPLIAGALEHGDLGYSAVRALTRVATAATEQRWRDAAIGKTVRQVYELAEGHEPGSDPEDPANPELKKRIERFELDPATYALLRQARQVLDDEHGRHLDDNELIAALCAAVLDGTTADRDGRAKFQVALTVCARCKQGWQDGAGAVIPVDAATVARADCDAQMIGSIDGDVPERASQTVPPSVARFVWRRDHGRCQTPGCRSARGIEIHHINARADGGSHEPRKFDLEVLGLPQQRSPRSFDDQRQRTGQDRGASRPRAAPGVDGEQGDRPYTGRRVADVKGRRQHGIGRGCGCLATVRQPPVDLSQADGIAVRARRETRPRDRSSAGPRRDDRVAMEARDRACGDRRGVRPRGRHRDLRLADPPSPAAVPHPHLEPTHVLAATHDNRSDRTLP